MKGSVMVSRNQKFVAVDQSKPKVNKSSHNRPTKKTTFNLPPEEEPPVKSVSLLMKTIAFLCLVTAGWFGYMGYLETRVNSPFSGQKVVTKSGLDVPERYWGSYRPGVYFGLKTRDPYSLVFGMMWYFPRQLRPDGGGIRHWCEQADNLDHYSWTEHDGKTFGIQKIDDGPFWLQTSFVKRAGGNHGGEWTARVRVDTGDTKLRGEPVSLLFYSAIEEKTKGSIYPTEAGKGKRLITGVVGETDGLGAFSIKIFNTSGTIEQESYLSTVTEGLHLISDSVLNSLRMVADKTSKKKLIILPGEYLPRMPDGQKAPPNLIVTQVTGRVPFEIDVVFESGSNMDRVETFTGESYTQDLKEHQSIFNERFESTFKLESKGYTSNEINFAKAAFSNLMGGIGYFYGTSRVQSVYTKGSVPYWKAPLYTAVPSRSFFPRGFLWDEGFHGLLISSWDLDIELDIISHWFDLMNIEGWIPREQILGSEALSKVPEEFVTQRNSNANPPTFFLTLQFILQNFASKLPEKEHRLKTLENLYPRLQTWFEWFNYTQIGDMQSTYRWRGRDPSSIRELNPKTLTSGLDDYPRASHPNIDERHVDLRCWIALSASVLSEIGKLLNRDVDKYSNTYAHLQDNSLLDEMHWSPQMQLYADYGLHTDAVVLKQPPSPKHPPGYRPSNPEKVRVVLQDPELRFVDSTFGYVSLFPLLLHLLEPNSLKLGKLLDDIKRPDLLWTEYGLRSVSKTSPFYMKYNTEHDPPYWRGHIWININYLTVRSLHHYSKIDGPYKSKAMTIYIELRKNLIRNIFKEFKRTGYIWENYHDKTGEGQGSRPFTGWSSLVVLLMAELY